MRSILWCILISHTILAIVILALTAWRGDALMHLTAREQFADWPPLLDVFSGDSQHLVADAQSAAWCNDTLPRGTTHAPFCACIAAQARAALNVSTPERAQAAWPLLSPCLRLRPVWRVRSVWKVQLAVPAVYALTSAAAFHLLALYPGVAWYWFAVAMTLVGGTLLAVQPLLNFSWATGVATLFVVLLWAVRPSLCDLRAAEVVGMCFWWAEACATPVYALYFLLLCTRDIVALSTGLTVAAVMGTMSLRSFWYVLMLKDKQGHICQRVRFSAWLAIAVGGVFYLALLPTQGSPLLSGGGGIAAMLVTLCISLAQVPTAHPMDMLLFQVTAAGARNAAFAVLLVFDLATPGLI